MRFATKEKGAGGGDDAVGGAGDDAMCEQILSRRLYYYHLPGWNLCIRSILMTFAGRAIFHFNHLCQGHLRASIEPW